MASPKFYRVVPGNTGSHCEGYGRALAHTGLFQSLKVFNALPLKVRRKWTWWHKYAVNRVKKRLGLRQDGIYTQQVHDWLVKGKFFDARAVFLVNSYMPPPPIPDLGPVWNGGKTILLQDLTHRTSNIDFYPAFDDAFVQGRRIIAPEYITVDKKYSSSHPGSAFYATGHSRIRYWFGHLDRNHTLGTTFSKGDFIGNVAPNSVGGGPHVHVGVNVELLWGVGKQLEHHTNYTHGAPVIGVQLEKGP